MSSRSNSVNPAKIANTKRPCVVVVLIAAPSPARTRRHRRPLLPYPPCNFSAVALIGTGLLRRPLGETITGRHTSGMGHSRSAQADSRASHVRCAQKAEVSGALAAARGSRRAQQDLEPFRLAEACGWGNMGYRASARAVIFERTDHRIDHAARQEIDGGFAAELVACAALDQPRAEAAMHRRHHRRAAGLGPY